MAKTKNSADAPSRPTITYDNALAELQQIVRQLEDDESGIDQLSEQVRRATELISFCRNKLRQAEIDIEKIW